VGWADPTSLRLEDKVRGGAALAATLRVLVRGDAQEALTRLSMGRASWSNAGQTLVKRGSN
jgi:hypothetical protein